MKQIKILLALVCISSFVLAGEQVIDLERVFYDEVTKVYGKEVAAWIMDYPTHPVVDVSGKEPRIHNGKTTTWRTFDPAHADWGAVFRIDAEGNTRGLYLYDNRLRPMPVNEDSVMLLVKPAEKK